MMAEPREGKKYVGSSWSDGAAEVDSQSLAERTFRHASTLCTEVTHFPSVPAAWKVAEGARSSSREAVRVLNCH